MTNTVQKNNNENNSLWDIELQKKTEKAEKEYMESVKKSFLRMSQERLEMKGSIDRLYDRIQDLRSALLKKQNTIQQLEEFAMSLLSAECDFKREETGNLILSIIKETDISNDFSL